MTIHTPTCKCGRRRISMNNNACWECRQQQARKEALLLRPLCSGCGQRRPFKGHEKCSICRNRTTRMAKRPPCAICGVPSTGDLCIRCSGIVKRDDRRRRVVTRLKAKGLTFSAIGVQLGGISRQRVEQMYRWQKNVARTALHHAVKSGRIQKPAFCERCENETSSLNAHHENYLKPLDVEWLCLPCHNIVHPHPGFSRSRSDREKAKKFLGSEQGDEVQRV